MQKENIALVTLVIVVVVAVSAFLLINYGSDLFKPEPTIETGDCADVHYIARYASNNTIFASSYNDTEAKTGGEPLNIYVNLSAEATPPTDYYSYSTTIDYDLVPGFVEGLKGLKKGDMRTIGPLDPEDAYGVSPKEGDDLDLSYLSQMYGSDSEYLFKITKIEKDTETPDEWKATGMGNITDLYTLRLESYYVGQVLAEDSNQFPSWVDGTVVTKINETKMWTYTTPTADIGESFTWLDIDSATGSATIYPENSTAITSMDNDTVVLMHTPLIGSEIIVQMSYYGEVAYTVENLTADKINISIVIDEGGNKSYQEIDRIQTINRNNSQNITTVLPSVFLSQILSTVRSVDSSMVVSLSPYADETVIFEVEIVEVYKTSEES